jgi:hypothetical protein
MFYVYVYKDPRPTKNQQVVYVGKGFGDRAWYHWKKRVRHNKGFGAFLALLRREKLEPIIEIVKDGLDEAEAFYEEISLIALYGRRDLNTGTLFNLTDGGEGTVGAIRTEEWKNNTRIANSTPEQISRQKAQALLLWSNKDWREKTIAAIRTALQDPEVIARREAGKAAFIHTEEFRQTMSAATSKMWENPDYAGKVAAAQVAVQSTPEARAVKSKNSKKLWQEKGGVMASSIKAARNTEESKAKTSAQAKTQWADPEYAAKQTANNKEIANREDVKAAKRAASKALWADPIWKAKMLAARKKHLDAPTNT